MTVSTKNDLSASRRILLVDDETVITQMLGALLHVKGYETIAVNDSGKAVDIIKSEKFDLMITDLRMNPINGMDLLRLAHSERPEMPTIMLTAYGSGQIGDEARHLGATEVLPKPFKPDQIFSAVAKALHIN